MIFHLDKNNRFGLRYPSLEERKAKFMSFVIDRLQEIDSRNAFSEYKMHFSPQLMELIELNREPQILNKMGPLYAISAMNTALRDVMPYEKDRVIKILENQQDDYYYFLYVLEKLLQSLLKVKEIKKNLVELLKWINKFDLDYVWDHKTKIFTRVLDDGSLSVINANLEIISEEYKENFRLYQESLDDFLKVKNVSRKNNRQIFFHESLNRMKKLLENVLSQKYGIHMSSKKAVANKLLKSGIDNAHIIATLDFIIKKIHHDENGTPYSFSEKEYIYWWLEINTLIYLLLK